MASPPSSFALDRSIFNQTLYTRMRNFWFGDLPPDASAANFGAAQKWFGAGKSEEEKEAFDGECRENFIHALEAVGPEKLALPKFESYEKEIENADSIAAPFLPEVRAAQEEDEKKGAETLMALLLILDQMSRNIFREPEGLRKVYLHYDRLAFSLLYASMRSLPSNPVDLPFYRTRPAYRTWFQMPLMHSEHLPSHEIWSQKTAQTKKAVEDAGDEDALKFLGMSLQAGEKHLDLLKRFGRYPHRNEYVGRETTEEEAEYLKDGDTFGVKTSGGGGKKEEGKTRTTISAQTFKFLSLPPELRDAIYEYAFANSTTAVSVSRGRCTLWHTTSNGIHRFGLPALLCANKQLREEAIRTFWATTRIVGTEAQHLKQWLTRVDIKLRRQIKCLRLEASLHNEDF